MEPRKPPQLPDLREPRLLRPAKLPERGELQAFWGSFCRIHYTRVFRLPRRLL